MTTQGTIEIEAVSKRYRSGNEALLALDTLSLTIQPGEFLSIVGASGCGKSTLLRLLTGLDVDYEGEIRVNGARVQGTSLDRGIVFQEHRLFPWLTVRQNVGLGLENSGWSRDKRDKAVQ